MLLNKKVLGVVNAASTDETRFAINGILIEKDGSAVATDGMMLVKFTPAVNGAPDPHEFPVIDGVNPVEVENLTPFILSQDSVAQLSKAMPKSKKHHSLPILDNIALDVAQTNANGNAVLAMTDLDNPQVFKPRKVDAQYPDWTKVLPEAGRGKVKVGISLKLLDKLVKTMKALGVEADGSVGGAISFEIEDATSPIRCEAKPKDQDGTIVAVLMPMRLS